MRNRIPKGSAVYAQGEMLDAAPPAFAAEKGHPGNGWIDVRIWRTMSLFNMADPYAQEWKVWNQS